MIRSDTEYQRALTYYPGDGYVDWVGADPYLFLIKYYNCSVLFVLFFDINKIQLGIITILVHLDGCRNSFHCDLKLPQGKYIFLTSPLLFLFSSFSSNAL